MKKSDPRFLWESAGFGNIFNYAAVLHAIIPRSGTMRWINLTQSQNVSIVWTEFSESRSFIAGKLRRRTTGKQIFCFD